jgi:hypothetical protein
LGAPLADNCTPSRFSGNFPYRFDLTLLPKRFDDGTKSRKQSVLTQLAWVGTAAFAAKWQNCAADFTNRSGFAQSVGSMGGNVHQDNIRQSHYVVPSCQEMHIVFRSTLPFDSRN